MKPGFTSIIIVNYNTAALTVNCIRSVKQHCLPGSYEIIVVDNASADESAAIIRKAFPEVTVIANKTNLGFGTANNIGAAAAQGEYLFLLNSDTIVKADVLTPLQRFAKEKQAAVTGILLTDEKASLVHSFGNFPGFLRKYLPDMAPAKKEAALVNDIQTNYFAQVDIVVGADMFIEKKIFEEAGGFDSNIFLYEEELELQYRLQQQGHRCYIINEKSIIHLEGQSSASYFKRKCSFLSLCYVYKKHLPLYRYRLWRLQMMLYALIFFKNPATSWSEKINYLLLTIRKK